MKSLHNNVRDSIEIIIIIEMIIVFMSCENMNHIFFRIFAKRNRNKWFDALQHHLQWREFFAIFRTD